MDSEKESHKRTEHSLDVLREAIKDNREKVEQSNDKLRLDLNEIKEMQWKTRMSMADLLDRSSKKGLNNPE